MPVRASSASAAGRRKSGGTSSSMLGSPSSSRTNWRMSAPSLGAVARAGNAGNHHRLGAAGAAIGDDAAGAVQRGADHGVGQGGAGQRLQRRQVFGDQVQRVREHVVRAAIRPPQSSSRFMARRSATGLTQKTRTASSARTDWPRSKALLDFGQQLGQHADGLLAIGAEVDGEHLGDEHFQGGQRRAGRAIDGLAQSREQAPDAVGLADALGQRRRSRAAGPPGRPAPCPAAPARRARIRPGPAARSGCRAARRPFRPARARGGAAFPTTRIGKPSFSSRCAMAEKSSQTAPVLQISRSGRGKCSPF